MVRKVFVGGTAKSLKGKNEGMSYRVVKKVKVIDQKNM